MTDALSRTTPASCVSLLASLIAIVAAARVADEGHALRVDSRDRTQRVERCRGVRRLAIEAHREEVAARLADSALVEAQRRDTTSRQRRRERVPDVEHLLRHVRVAVERSRTAEDQRGRRRALAPGSNELTDERHAVVRRHHVLLRRHLVRRMHPCGRS